MEAEMTTHLGYEKHDPAAYGSGSSRNGKSKKRLKGNFAKSRSKSLETDVLRMPDRFSDV